MLYAGYRPLMFEIYTHMLYGMKVGIASLKEGAYAFSKFYLEAKHFWRPVAIGKAIV